MGRSFPRRFVSQKPIVGTGTSLTLRLHRSMELVHLIVLDTLTLVDLSTYVECTDGLWFPSLCLRHKTSNHGSVNKGETLCLTTTQYSYFASENSGPV